jgi:hypothetical protein
VDYEDATYRFVNAENMKLFKNYPEKYASQYGGYCAFGAAMEPSSMAGIQVGCLSNGDSFGTPDSQLSRLSPSLHDQAPIAACTDCNVKGVRVSIKEVSTMAFAGIGPVKKEKTPPMDEKVPARTETATFALG